MQWRVVFRIAAVILCAIALAIIGGLVAWCLGAFLIDLRVIKPDAHIDDDAAIINMGIAFAGALTGLIGGLIAGWRLTRRGSRE